MDFEKYLDKALELGNKAVSEHGQQAWDTALLLVRIEAAQNCVFALALLIGGVLLFLKSYIGFWDWLSKWEEDTVPFRVFGLLISTPMCIIGLIMTLHIWKWIGLFYPELYLAKLAIDKVL